MADHCSLIVIVIKLLLLTSTKSFLQKRIAKSSKIMYNTNMSKFIGIYGGAFDPPHISHIACAKALIKERGYDKLIFLPSHNPPHKKLSASDADRLNMLSLVLEDNIEISQIELKRKGIGYTIDYLPDLFSAFGDNIEFIIGGDSFLNFQKWHKPNEILKSVKILVVPRDGERERLIFELDKYDKNNIKGIEIAKFLPVSMSSSEIRNALRLHLNVDNCLDVKVLDYIKTNNLYNEYNVLLGKLEKNISEERLLHTQGVVMFALKYADKLKLDYDKVFISALLHDCAKNIDCYDGIYDKYPLPKDSNNTPIAHAFCGSAVAYEEYGIKDIEILEAIYCHTTAKPNMTTLSKLIYVADMLEEGRNFDGVEQLRQIVSEDFEKGFFACLESTVKFLQNEDREIYPLTLSAYEYYKKLQ